MALLRRDRQRGSGRASLEDRWHRPRTGADQLDIAVVRLPRISNYDDLLPLEHGPGVVVRFVESPGELAGAEDVVTGYEIHMGRVERIEGAQAAFEIRARSGEGTREGDGAVSADGAVVGTMIHGLFENDALRRSLLGALRHKKQLPAAAATAPGPRRDDENDRLAAAVEASLDRALLDRILGIGGGDQGLSRA